MKDIAEVDRDPLAEVRRGDTVILGTLANGEDVVVEAGDCLSSIAARPDPRADVCFDRC